MIDLTLMELVGGSFSTAFKGLGLKVPIQETNDWGDAMLDIDDDGKTFLNYGKPVQEVNDGLIAYQDKQAFDLLYSTLQEVRDIVHRGIKDGQQGYKRALLKAQEKLRGIE